MAKPIIKSASEIELMRKSGSIAASVLREAAKWVQPGISTGELDRRIGQLILDKGATSAFYRYRGFPGQCCISVNEAVIHGIGDRRQLALGDLVKLDVGVRYKGFVGDVAMTIGVGAVSLVNQKLMDTTVEALYAGISVIRPGNRIADIGQAVQSVVERAGFGVVREFCGHGVGQSVHEEPQVPNYVEGRGGLLRLKPGMTIAIEPMVTHGEPSVKILADRWTVVTKNGGWSSHFEHTVAVTEGEPEILTRDELGRLY